MRVIYLIGQAQYVKIYLLLKSFEIKKMCVSLRLYADNILCMMCDLEMKAMCL